MKIQVSTIHEQVSLSLDGSTITIECSKQAQAENIMNVLLGLIKRQFNLKEIK